LGYLGIDTSCYTTSVAYLSGEELVEKRTILTVPLGKRGLRQSEALFQHLKNLPPLISQLKLKGIKAVAASTKPRPTPDSYMPVFQAGTTVAQSIAGSLGCPFIATSHQEGHLWAGFWSCGLRPQGKWLAFHISGGTTDLLLLPNGMKEIRTLGSSMDLHAGQFIDRIGVRLGLSFPAGPELEELARKGRRGKVTFPAPIRGYDLSFSGPESAAVRAMEEGAEPGDVALAVLLAVGRGVVKALEKAKAEHGADSVLFVGGVTANGILRSFLQEKLPGFKLYFADPRYSTDNAVGVAVAAREALGCRE